MYLECVTNVFNSEGALGDQESFSLATTAAIGTLGCLIILYVSELVTLRYPSLSASGSTLCRTSSPMATTTNVLTP